MNCFKCCELNESHYYTVKVKSSDTIHKLCFHLACLDGLTSAKLDRLILKNLSVPMFKKQTLYINLPIGQFRLMKYPNIRTSSSGQFITKLNEDLILSN